MTLVSSRLAQLKDKLTDEKARLEEEKKGLESAIDDLVYTTYGLTDAEKKTIENSLQ